MTTKNKPKDCIECEVCEVIYSQFYCQDESMLEESTRGRLIGYFPPSEIFPGWCPRYTPKFDFKQARAVK